MADSETTLPSGDRHEIELRAIADIERLPGVVTAAIWLRQDSSLREARIHVMPGAAPTIVANAACRVLEALAVSCELRDIRTFPLALPDDVQPAQNGGGRFLLLHDLTLTRTGSHIVCSVQLIRDQMVAAGEARELDTTAGRARAAAAATLRAAEQTTPNLALGLETAAVTALFGRQYAVAAVEACIGRRIATLSALVQVDASRGPEEAVCLAVLRAIDRWIAL